MSTRLTHVGLAGLLLILGGACGASAEVMRWQVDGETREAIVYAPAAPPGGEGVPLVLSFHGFGDNMQNFQHTDMHVAWPDAIVVYFQGLETRRGLPGWQVERGGGDRDLKLVDVALASLRETYDVDADRIYATGFSNGGMFTYLLWAERSGVFAAGSPPPSLGSARAAEAHFTRGRRARSARALFGSRRRDRGRHRGERRGHDDDALWGGLHGLRARHARTGHDLDPSGRPRLSAWHQRADRLLFSGSFPHPLIDAGPAIHISTP